MALFTWFRQTLELRSWSSLHFVVPPSPGYHTGLCGQAGVIGSKSRSPRKESSFSYSVR